MPAEPTKRLDLSRRTISGWEATGGPHGRPADNLRMIREELRILAGIASEHPRLAESVDALSKRYGAMANRLRLSSN